MEKGLGSIFKRVALLLLSKGAKIAAPHLLKPTKGIGRELVGQLLDGSTMAPMPRRKKIEERTKQKRERKKVEAIMGVLIVPWNGSMFHPPRRP